MLHDPAGGVGTKQTANRRIKTPRALAGAAAASGKRQVRRGWNSSWTTRHAMCAHREFSREKPARRGADEDNQSRPYASRAGVRQNGDALRLKDREGG